MRCLLAGFVFGIGLLQQQASLMPWLMFVTLIFLACLLIWVASTIELLSVRSAIKLSSGVVIGWCWAGLIAIHGLAEQLAPELEGQDIAVVGVITSLPVKVDYGQRFQFHIERVLTAGVNVNQLPSKILLGWYDANFQTTSPVRVETSLQPGERWRLTVRLRRPHGLANPHGFDYEVWLLELGIGATGSVRLERGGPNQAEPDLKRLNGFVFTINNMIERLRGQLRERILRALPEQSCAPIIVALVIGDQSAVSQDDWTLFARTGVSHLFAISGLHISMLSALAAGIVFYFWRHSLFTRYQWPLWMPAQKVAALAAMAVALIYVALAGFGVPAQRTLIMISVVSMSSFFDRKAGASHVLLLALGLVLLVDPWALLWPGFWLSFSAVALIFYVSLGRRENLTVDRGAAPRSTLRGWAGCLRQASTIQYAITVGLVPLTMLLFNQVSLVGPIANAIAIPVVSFLVTPLSLISCAMPGAVGDLMFNLTHTILDLLLQCLAYLNNFSWAVWRAPQPGLWMFICALVGTIWCLAPRGWPYRFAGLIAWLPLCLNTHTYPRQGEIAVTALDIGQGMALLIETAHHRLLYDTGPAYSPGSDAGSRVIYPYLNARRIYHLDGLIISHNDIDHSGGAMSLLKQVNVDWVASSLNPDSAIVQMAASRSQHLRCVAGQKWNWDNVQFEVLHPPPSVYDSDKWKPNARSCTLKISNGPHSILLAGDIEAVQEDELVHGAPDKLPSTVLLAPHHGSGTSSTLNFLKAVKPQLALFQFGYHNRYRHPKREVWQRYADLGIVRLRNDQAGAITLRFGSVVEAELYRQTPARYWYPNAAPDVD